MDGQHTGNNTFIALTAVWAFVESGLGGVMHALHLPFTGIFLGGFSVLIVSLIGHFDPKPYRQILKATLIVAVIKASVNPLTSPMAYIAVGFQGLCGALLFSFRSRNLFVCLLYAVLAMLESAFQKLLIMTLIFGKQWYIALEEYSSSAASIFGYETGSGFAWNIVSVYVGIYLVWGILLGVWSYRLPSQILSRKHLYDDLAPSLTNEKKPKHKGNKKRLIIAVSFIMIFLSTYIFGPDNHKPAGSILLIRTLSVLLAWIFVVLPVWKMLLEKLVRNNKDRPELPLIQEKMQELSAFSGPLLNAVRTRFKRIFWVREYVLGLIVIGLKNDERL